LWQFVIFCGNWVLFNAHLTYFVAIGHILWLFGVFCDHLVNFVTNCNLWQFDRILWPFGIFSHRFGNLQQEKSGNPAIKVSRSRRWRWGHAKICEIEWSKNDKQNNF
jgi:hypothetical protein